MAKISDDGSGAVDRHVAGDHANVVAAEPLREIKELLAHQRLDRRRVEHALPGGERQESKPQRDGRLPRTRRRAQDDVVAQRERHARVFLVRPQLDTAFQLVVDEHAESVVGGSPTPEGVER